MESHGGRYSSDGPKITATRPLQPTPIDDSGVPKPHPITSVHAKQPGHKVWDVRPDRGSGEYVLNLSNATSGVFEVHHESDPRVAEAYAAKQRAQGSPGFERYPTAEEAEAELERRHAAHQEAWAHGYGRNPMRYQGD